MKFKPSVMKVRKRTFRSVFCFLGAAFMTIVMAACGGSVVYDEYQHTAVSGWEKIDSLMFGVPRVTAPGTYDLNLGLRINGLYPFLKLTLIVDQTVFPSRVTTSDTLNCSLIDKHGNPETKGISSYQYTFPVKKVVLQSGDSLHISVRHDMKREVMPGISDVGIIIKKE
jgi:gliding motility-associated lipoprotein GldH